MHSESVRAEANENVNGIRVPVKPECDLWNEETVSGMAPPDIFVGKECYKLLDLRLRQARPTLLDQEAADDFIA